MTNLKYDLIAFDCDGTLTDSARQIVSFCNNLNISGKYSLPLIDLENPPRVKSILGATMEIVFTRYGFPQEEIPHLLEICKRIYIQDSRYIASPFPGIVPMLEKLKREKVTTGLVTANLLENVTRDLGSSIKDFTEVVDRKRMEKNSWKKQDALQWMKQHYRSSNPIYVGDTLKDQESAEKAGWPFIWVTYGWENPPANYPNQAKSVDNLVNLLEI